MGGVLGALLVRRRGVYFAMVTIAFGQVFYYIAFQWSSLTGGDDGLRGFERQPLHLGFATVDILSDSTAFYYFVLGCFALVVAVMAFILRSPFGRTMLAIRENERRARFLGIPIEQHIWIAFTLSCFFMAFAGSLYALVNNFADPLGLHYSQSGNFVIMAVLGGMRRFLGTVVGRGGFRRAAGLRLEHHHQLADFHRHLVRAGGAVLPARPPGLPSAAHARVSLSRVEWVGKAAFFNFIGGFPTPRAGRKVRLIHGRVSHAPEMNYIRGVGSLALPNWPSGRRFPSGLFLEIR